MGVYFFKDTTEEEQHLYIKLLTVTASLSNLFAESESPFLYYRAMENIFCKAFNADNYSRSDVSADAGRDRMGIGLKTFLQANGKTLQKVAEFNKVSYLFKDLSTDELIKKVAELRNERILSTRRICDLNDMIYHVITRSKNHMAIYEEHMDLVDIDNIIITKVKNTSIHFEDGLHQYSFNLSKSTLLKKFDTSEQRKIYGFDVEILEDPFEFLLASYNQKDESINQYYISEDPVNFRVAEEMAQYLKAEDTVDYIVLPLYSPRTGKVELKSGLNQWNAGGRARNENEVYISVPKWIHREKRDFFTYNSDDDKTDAFDVKLPNGKVLSMKIAQQGGKALMSNPNSALGEWILREVLELKPGELVTKEMLDVIGIDSVKLSKLNNDMYALDFLKLGSYEEFEADML